LVRPGAIQRAVDQLEVRAPIRTDPATGSVPSRAAPHAELPRDWFEAASRRSGTPSPGTSRTPLLHENLIAAQHAMPAGARAFPGSNGQDAVVAGARQSDEQRGAGSRDGGRWTVAAIARAFATRTPTGTRVRRRASD